MARCAVVPCEVAPTERMGWIYQQDDGPCISYGDFCPDHARWAGEFGAKHLNIGSGHLTAEGAIEEPRATPTNGDPATP